MRATWRSTTTAPGGQCVTTPGPAGHPGAVLAAGLAAPRSSLFGDGFGPISLDHVPCTGDRPTWVGAGTSAYLSTTVDPTRLCQGRLCRYQAYPETQPPPQAAEPHLPSRPAPQGLGLQGRQTTYEEA